MKKDKNVGGEKGVCKVTDQNYYMNILLRKNLDIISKIIKEDWDFVLCVDGEEGSGKSVLAMQICYYLDRTFNVDRIAFTPVEFRKAILEAKKGQAVLYDEAITGLSARQSLTYINTAIVAMLAQIRQKNLIIIIIMPSFFDLDKYVAVWRSRALIHVYTGSMFKRGKFAFYNYGKKLRLYVFGKRTYDYRKTKYNFAGNFVQHYTVNEKEYKDRKFKKMSKEDMDTGLKYKAQRDRLIKWVYHKLGEKTKDIVNVMEDITPRAIQYIVKKGKEE